MSPTLLPPSLLGVASTPIREHASESYTGRGVTIAFLDGGFVPHADLMLPHNRVLEYRDFTGEDVPFESPPEFGSWHGTMVAVVAAGNGHLSRGVYRSIAPEARVVLLRVVTREIHILEENVVRALQWVRKNRVRLGIGVVNVSLAAGGDVPSGESPVDREAQALVDEGVVVVAAAGNSGAVSHCLPPASCPGVLTVGGCTDDGEESDFYPATCVGAADPILKPELLALAGRVAAPVLPGTLQYETDEPLFHLHAASDERLPELLRRLGKRAGLPEGADELPVHVLRELVEELVAGQKLVAPHYQHADGTSFAAAITSSVVAHLLEANPSLTPAMVKHVLIATADRIRGYSRRLQGFGMINPRRAVELATTCYRQCQPDEFAPPHLEGDELVFHYHDARGIRGVSLHGSFNGWACGYRFTQVEGSRWILRIPVPPPGKHVYKLLVHGQAEEAAGVVGSGGFAMGWVPDPNNLCVEPDGVSGVNSVIHLA